MTPSLKTIINWQLDSQLFQAIMGVFVLLLFIQIGGQY